MTALNQSTVTVETLPVITFQDVRVLTTDLLAQVYGTEIDNIRKNHSRNQDRFECGKHFFLLEGDDLREFKELHRVTNSHSVKISPRIKALILWTERGAARHAKMLETDQAWNVFEKLEDAYFRPPSRKTGHYQQPALPTDLPSALRAYAAEIENHQHDSSVIEMLNQQNAILKEFLEICLKQLAFQQCDDPDKATSTAFRHCLSAPFINYIKQNRIHRNSTSKNDPFVKALDQLFIGTLEELKSIQAYLEISFRW
ncbi:hypothetical protein CKO09_11665 [Chromatium weissei]|nr:hypothetical protein [Chromatium weissei]